MLYLNEILCEDNREFSDAEIERLAVSIGNVGLLNPLTLESLPDPVGCVAYRVIAGRRRYRALMLLQRYELADDEYRIVDPGDAELVSFVENVERKDLSLGEEVRQLTELRARYDVGELASLLGRSRAYVALRLNLGNLAGRWRDVLKSPEDYPQWSFAKLALIAREPPAIQRQIDLYIPQALSVKELNLRIAALHRLLSSAPFDVAACAGCAARSDAQPDLFADMKTVATCLDPACWSRRCASACKTILREHPDLEPIRASGLAAGAAEDKLAESLGAKAEDAFAEVRRPHPGEQPNALIVRGPGIGTQVVALSRRQAAPSADAEPPAPREKTAAEMEAELTLRRHRLALRHLADTLTHADVAKLIRDRLEEDFLRGVLRLALAVGLPPHPDELGALETLPGDLLPLLDTMCAAVCGRAAELLRMDAGRPDIEASAAVGELVCQYLNLDWTAEYFAPARAELPESKALLIARAKEKTQKKM